MCELRDKLPPDKYPLIWVTVRLAGNTSFETIMVGTDPQIYEDFINGKASAEDIQKCMKKFMNYVARSCCSSVYEAAGRLVRKYGMIM